MKIKSKSSAEDVMSTLNFAIRKATSDGAKKTTEALIRIRTDYMLSLENFEGDFPENVEGKSLEKRFKPALTLRKRRYS